MIHLRFPIIYLIFFSVLVARAAAAPVISEFMADNASVLADEDGAFSDWIEIRNPDATPLDLGGWHLTDDAADLTKWTIPVGVTIPARGHLIVFASNKNRAIAGSELHTNFKLTASGEYLALVQPGGGVVGYEIAPQFPQQLPDFSYGFEGSGVTLLGPGDELSYLVPQNGTLGTTWTMSGFDDSAWTSSMAQISSFPSANVPRTASNSTFSISSGVTTSTLAVAGMPVLASGLTLKLNVTHSGSSNYTVDLISPQGTSLLITGNQGASRIIDIDLNQFNGESPNGNWTMKLTESGGFFSSGSSTLQSWSMELANGTTEPIVSGIGYEDSPTAQVNFTSEISTELPSGTGGAYVRQAFSVTDPAEVSGLKLRMKFDDGFVAYLNGVKVADFNAPASPVWNTLATVGHPDLDALDYVDFDISSHSGLLIAGGNNVLAIHMLNESTGSSDFLMVAELVAIIDNGMPPVMGYIPIPTPGSVNESSVYLGLLDDTTFMVKRGLFNSAFTETITTSDTGATLIYTTNGSVPSLSNGIQVAPVDEFTPAVASVPINTTTVLRAIAVKDDFLPTNVDTQTYLFVADVLQQDGAGFPTPPNSSSTWDYVMDPDVVNDPRYPNLESDLMSIPSLSIVIPEADVWGANGVYANPQELGSEWERACSVEVLNPDGSPNYQVEGGLKLQGAGSRARAIGKKSMRLVFRKRYGDSSFKYPLWGATGPDDVGTIVLRGDYFDSWTFQADGSGDGISRRNAVQLRSHFATITGEAMGLPTIATNWSHIYINGQYWGIYNTHERPDAEFAEVHLGGDEDDYTVLKHRPRGTSSGSAPEVSRGDLVKWNELMALMSQDASQTSVYNNILSRIEVDNFIDYILLNIWGGNEDWPHNNWYSIRHEPTDGPFMFYVWDPENFMYKASANRTGVNTNNSPGIIYDRLRDNAEFQLRFADHVRKHMFNGGSLAVPVMQSRWQATADELQGPMNAEAARWGDEHTSSPYNTIDHYLPEIARRKNDYIPQRHDDVISQLRSVDLYPDTNAPDFSQHGGQMASGYVLTISNPNSGGTIYFTTDGSDPRLEGGAVSGAATQYAVGIPITADVTVKARVLDGGGWSALNEADFRLAVLANASSLVVSEFSYNPAPPSTAEIAEGYNDADDFEFLEIMNISAEVIDLRNVEFALGVTFNFATSAITTLAPGGRLVVAENTAAFEYRYGLGVPVGGQFVGKLSNGGELIILQEKSGAVIQQFTYGDNYPWPDSADGQGASLVLKTAASNPNPDLAGNWRASGLTNGTPGGEETLPSTPANPLVDADGNGRVDLVDYTISGLPTGGRVAVNTSSFLTLEFTQKVTAEGADVTVQYSEDMMTWTSGATAVELVSETFNNDGTVTYVSRSLQPQSTMAKQFMRVKVTERP